MVSAITTVSNAVPVRTISARVAARNQISARQPLFWAASFFSVGIVAGNYAWRPPSWWVIAGIVFVASAICIVRKRILSPKILAFAALIAVGALSIQMRRSLASEQSLWFGDGEVQITAHVITEGEIQSEGDRSYRQRVDIETETIDSDPQTKRIAEGIRLSIYQNDRGDSHNQMRSLSYGERLRFRTTLVLPRNYRNPGAFDYAGYLRDNGIVATASVKYSGLEILPGFVGSKIETWRARAHRSIIGKIHVLWAEQTAGLMDAIVLGEETFVERPTRVDFQRSGTYHVLVVSGMNVSILAMFALWSLRRVGLGQVAASACAIVVILAYAALTKEGPPVWRAALMFAAYLCARLVYRDRAMLNALGAAALILLVADPRVLFGASFQMTFLCVALVAGIGVPVLERTLQPYSQGLRSLNALAYDRALPPRIAQFRLDMRLLLNRFAMIVPGRLPRGATLMLFRISFAIFELTVMSAILQLGLALPMAYYFHRATSVAMPANLFVIPFLELLMPAGVCAICMSYVWLTIAKVPALIAAFALQGIAGTVRWLGGMRLADIRVPTPGLSAIVFCIFATLMCAIFVRKKTALAFAGIAVLSASALWIWLIPPHQDIRPNILEMTAIDVGQGDSILLITPEGRKLLVDAGGLPFWTHSQMDIGEDVVSPYLWSRGISRIDAVALTHAHADHMGGMFAVIANFRPRELWLPEGIPDSEIERLLDEAHSYGVRIIYRKAGDIFSYGGTRFGVLAPAVQSATHNTGSDSHRNDESLVMKVEFRKTSALLEADAEKPTENFIATEDPSADVLKVAHHGSASSSAESLLAAVRPRFAVISVGARNVYHHPRPEVLARLQNSHIITYRTDMDGATSFFLDGTTVTSHVAAIR
ncbi:MAG TPA: ComEC/Rec2 family competence protein [Terriglobales bacterium]|nr:ComEC/Rec2 family competence protein [Terriglobales bacterium]